MLCLGLADQGFEDSDNSSIFSGSPSPKSHQRSIDAGVTENSQRVELRQRMTTNDQLSALVQRSYYSAHIN